MNAPLLSVVMPVYNVAPYLARCLNSIAVQTRPVDELIVIDDGSTDDCPRILADYAGRLPRMRVIRQENGGLSAARNAGMELATGQYLAFVDSDDFVDPRMYERLLTQAQSDDLDIALCNASYHFEDREPDRLIYTKAASTSVISGKEWLRNRLLEGHLMHMVWMHLYRRDFLMKHGFRFVPRLIHEDVVWTTQVLLAADRVRYDSTPFYHYRLPIRTFTPERNRNRLEAIIQSSIYNAKELLRMAESSLVDDELGRLLRWQAVDGAFSIFHKIEKIQSAAWQKSQYCTVQSSGLFLLLWRGAVDWKQRRRIMHRYLKFIFNRWTHY